MQALAFKAYGEVTQRTAGDKELEYALFRQITAALESVQDPQTRSFPEWVDALSRNQQLWSLIANDLLHPGNGLPDHLKRSLIVLSEFVRQSSIKALGGEELISDLIEVNRTVMAGLVGQLETGMEMEEEGL